MGPESWEIIRTGGVPAILFIVIGLLLRGDLITRREFGEMRERLTRYETQNADIITLARRMSDWLDREGREGRQP